MKLVNDYEEYYRQYIEKIRCNVPLSGNDYIAKKFILRAIRYPSYIKKWKKSRSIFPQQPKNGCCLRRWFRGFMPMWLNRGVGGEHIAVINMKWLLDAPCSKYSCKCIEIWYNNVRRDKQQ